MAGIHEMLQVIRLAVPIEWRIQIHPVIAPPTFAGEISDWHQLNVGYAQFFQIIQVGFGRFERSFGRKSAEMQLVNECTGERGRLPEVIAPNERRVVDYS